MPQDPMPSENQSPETSASFHFNAKVAQMLAIILLALAMPITIAVLGFLEIRKKSHVENSQTIAEPLGLRAAFEHAADASWKAPQGLSSSYRRFELTSQSQEECLRIYPMVKEAAANFGALVVTAESNDPDAVRWMAQLPADSAMEFEDILESLGFSGPQHKTHDPKDGPVFYELQIRSAK
jgi:hypothetical protein